MPDRGSDPTLTTKEGNKSNGRVNVSMEAMGMVLLTEAMAAKAMIAATRVAMEATGMAWPRKTIF